MTSRPRLRRINNVAVALWEGAKRARLESQLLVKAIDAEKRTWRGVIRVGPLDGDETRRLGAQIKLDVASEVPEGTDAAIPRYATVTFAAMAPDASTAAAFGQFAVSNALHEAGVDVAVFECAVLPLVIVPDPEQ